MKRAGVWCLLGLTAAVGCQASRSASVSVELKNESRQPVTVWVTKTGQRNAEWLAPEDLSLEVEPQMVNGVVIPPGKTGELGPLKGRFEGESVPILRVYAGSLDFDHLLATRIDGVLRVDVTLDDGMNRLKVVNSGKLEVVPMAGK